MGMFGGGGQAGGWSQGIGGQGGQQPHRRGADGWDEEYLGKVYDAEVVRRVFPYLKEYKIHAAISLVTMTIAARLIAGFYHPRSDQGSSRKPPQTSVSHGGMSAAPPLQQQLAHVHAACGATVQISTA